MEDALRGTHELCEIFTLKVLILVLMEDTLRALVAEYQKKYQRS